MQTLLWQQTRLLLEISVLTVIFDSDFAFLTTHIFFLIKRSLTHFKTKAVSGREEQFVFTLQQIEVLTTYSSCTLQQMINTQIHTDHSPAEDEREKRLLERMLKKKFHFKDQLINKFISKSCLHSFFTYLIFSQTVEMQVPPVCHIGQKMIVIHRVAVQMNTVRFY